jgi:hypothetical protein
MATNLFSQTIGSKLYIKNYDHDPGGTSATVVSPDGGTTKYIQDMRDFSAILYQSTTSVSASSSGVTKLEIVGYADSAGAGTAYQIKDSGAVVADAVGDEVKVECTAAEIAQIGSANSVNLRYVTARLTCSNAGDEARVAMVAVGGRAYDDLTPDTRIA